MVVELSKATGMLTKLGIESKNDYAGIIDAVGSGTTTILDAGKEIAQARANDRKAEADAEAEENDPIAQKKRELELLELQRQIACYEDEGVPCPPPDVGGESSEGE